MRQASESWRISSRIPRLQEILKEEFILLDVDAKNLEDVCRPLIQRLVDQRVAPQEQAESLAQKILARENVASTAIGEGVACPHAFMDELDRPVVLFARLKSALDLKAPDGIPTDLVFLLVGKKEDARGHLNTLMQLSRLLQDDGFRNALRGAEAPDVVVAATAAAGIRLKAPEPTVSLARLGIETRTGRFAGGVIDDVKRRLPYYLDDFKQGVNLRSLAATIFLFFACFTGAVTFGALTAAETGGLIDTFDMIVVTALGGVVYALLGGQPLVLLGGTGPILIFTALLYRLSGQLELPFLPCYAWVGLWSAAFIMLLALADASVLLRYVTRFTDEVFVLLMAAIFIDEALRKLVGAFRDDLTLTYATALSAVVLAIGTMLIALLLRHLRKSKFLRAWARNFLADFGTVIAIGSMVILAYYMGGTTDLPHIAIPSDFSLNPNDYWISLLELPTWAIFGSAIPAVFLTILVFLTQQLTARVVNSPELHLQKGPGYHLDLMVIGLLMIPSSLFGLPWLCAATVRSLNHVKALSSTHGEAHHGQSHIMTDRVNENRLTGVAIHLLICGSLLILPVLKWVPMACLYGIFLYMGVVSFAGNQFWERITLWVTDPELYPATHYIKRVPNKVVHWFTAIQFGCFVVLWAIKVSAMAILFPLFLAVLVPVRLIMNRFFDTQHLLFLDSEESLEEEEEREVE